MAEFSKKQIQELGNGSIQVPMLYTDNGKIVTVVTLDVITYQKDNRTVIFTEHNADGGKMEYIYKLAKKKKIKPSTKKNNGI